MPRFAMPSSSSYHGHDIDDSMIHFAIPGFEDLTTLTPATATPSTHSANFVIADERQTELVAII